MFTDLNQYVKVLTQLNITANQFLLCYLLYTDQKKGGKYVKKGKAMANLYKYAEKCTPWSKEETRDLVDKGYLEDPNYQKDKTYPDYLVVTDKFKNLVVVQDSQFEELYKEFPTTIDNFKDPRRGKIKLKVCDKYVMRKLYKKKVRSKVQHRRIMELLKWAKENNEINFNFENFIKGEMWDTLKEIRDGDGSPDNNNMTAAR